MLLPDSLQQNIYKNSRVTGYVNQKKKRVKLVSRHVWSLILIVQLVHNLLNSTKCILHCIASMKLQKNARDVNYNDEDYLVFTKLKCEFSGHKQAIVPLYVLEVNWQILSSKQSPWK